MYPSVVSPGAAGLAGAVLLWVLLPEPPGTILPEEPDEPEPPGTPGAVGRLWLPGLMLLSVEAGADSIGFTRPLL